MIISGYHRIIFFVPINVSLHFQWDRDGWRVLITVQGYQSSKTSSLSKHRLVGLVVKASASKAEGPWFESRLRRDFFGVESYQ